MAKEMLITKQDGTQEEFDVSKLHRSLIHSGASEKASREVIQQIEKGLIDGMNTSQIYEHAFSLLQRTERKSASRYSMKRAVLALGPSGYPFENFIAEIFRADGFSVEVGKIVQGACVEHEVDIIGEKEGKHLGAEIKFHNKLGIRSDLKVALYVHARFEDIRKANNGKGDNLINEEWLITNTKFTKNAIQYGKCVNMEMVSWNHPESGNLQDLIEKAKIQPITALTTLSSQEKTRLMDHKVVLCRNIEHNENIMHSIGFKREKIENVMAESQALCNI